MDYKRVLKNIAFIAFVPTVVVVGYYGYKAIKKKIDDEALKKQGSGKRIDPNVAFEKTTLKNGVVRLEPLSKPEENTIVESVKPINDL